MAHPRSPLGSRILSALALVPHLVILPALADTPQINRELDPSWYLPEGGQSLALRWQSTQSDWLVSQSLYITAAAMRIGISIDGSVRQFDLGARGNDARINWELGGIWGQNIRGLEYTGAYGLIKPKVDWPLAPFIRVDWVVNQQQTRSGYPWPELTPFMVSIGLEY